MPNIVWDLIYRDRGVERGLKNVAGAHDQAERKAKAYRAAAVGAFLVVGAAAVKFGISSARAYSEAQTAQGKLSDAFSRFPKLADTNQAALQRLNAERQKSTRFDDDATAAAQAQLAQYKLTGQQLTELTPLIQDYAAKTGKDLPAAARDLGKSLLGESRALKVVGLDLKDTGSTTGNYTQLVKGLRTQVGGFAEKEGKTAAGRIEILKNQFGELQEAAGAHLVPALSAGVDKLTDLVEVVGENADVIVPLAGAVVGLTTAVWLGNKAVKAYAVAQGILSTAMSSNSRIATGFAAVVGKAGPWGVAIGAGATLLGVFAGQQELAKRETRGFTDSLTFQKGVLDANSAQMLVKKLADEGALDAAKRAGVAEGDYVRALMQGGSARDAVIQQLTDTGTAARANVDAFEGDVVAQEELANSAFAAADKLTLMGNGLDSSKRAAELAESAYRNSGGAIDATAVASEALGKKTFELKNKQKDLNVELQKSIDKFTVLREGALSVETANVAWEGSLDNIRKSVKENGKSLDIHSEAGRNNRSAIADSMRAMNDKATADFKATEKSKGLKVATEQASDRLRTNKKSLRDAATAAGFNKDQIDAMIRKMLKTPKELRTDIKTKDMKKVLDEIEDLKKQIQKLKDKLLGVKVEYSSSGSVRLQKVTRGNKNQQGALGTVLAGWSPGRDIHRFTSPSGGTLDLSGGEAVMRPEWTKAVGGAPAVARMNAAARAGRLNEAHGPIQAFADGGVVRKLTVGMSGNSHPDVAGAYSRGVSEAVSSARSSALSVARGYAEAEVRRQRAALAAIAAAKAATGSGSVAAGPGWGPIMAAMRRHGARSFTTYPGHHPSMARARDVTPHNWAMANAAKALSSVWYVIYRMRIASKNHGNGWRQYHPISNRGDWRHEHHIHVAKRDRGGMFRQGTTAINVRGGDERILTARQNVAYERMVRVSERQGAGNTTVIINAPNYVGSQDDLRRTLIEMNRRGQLEVIKR